MLPEKVFEEAARRSRKADLFIVIGSTLIVYPAADMPIYAVDSGAKLVIINLSPTPMDNQAAVLIRAKAGEVMSRVIQRVRERVGGL
jgi:NAD-dependent deacetylase